MSQYSGVRDKVHTLRINTKNGSGHALRMSIAKSIAELDLRPPGMSPSAVLFVKHIQDQLPGSNKTAWKASLKNKMNGIYGQAVKPQAGKIIGNPDAVLFKDKAELLISLLVDICAGTATNRWWWRSRQFPSIYPSSQIKESLIQDTEYIPAVFTGLIDIEKGLDVVKKLDTQDAHYLVHALLHKFQLASLSRKLIRVEMEVLEQCENTGLTSGSNIEYRNHLRTINYPPWVTLFSNELWRSDLKKEQAILIGLARTLQEKPLLVRNTAFQSGIEQWWAGEVLKESSHDETEEEYDKHEDYARSEILEENREYTKHKDIHSQALDKPFAVSGTQDTTQSDSPTGKQAGYLSKPIDQSPGSNFSNSYDGEKANGENWLPINHDLYSRSNLPDLPQTLKEEGVDIFQDDMEEAHHSLNFQTSSDASIHNSGVLSHHKNIADVESDEAVLSGNSADVDVQNEDTVDSEDFNTLFSEAFFDSELGGVFYLINLLQQLDFPYCLDNRDVVSRQLSPWCTLDALARSLLGKEYLRVQHDPIWVLLAKLDSRRNKSKLGEKFKAPSSYRLISTMDKTYFGLVIGNKSEYGLQAFYSWICPMTANTKKNFVRPNLTNWACSGNTTR